MTLTLGPVALTLTIVVILVVLVGSYKLAYAHGLRKGKASYGDMLARAGSRFTANDL